MFELDKKPWEEKTEKVNFAGLTELQAGETISNVSVEIFFNNTIQTGMFVSSEIEQANVFFRIRGGEHGKDYVIIIRLTTNRGHQREQHISLKVRN